MEHEVFEVLFLESAEIFVWVLIVVFYWVAIMQFGTIGNAFDSFLQLSYPFDDNSQQFWCPNN